MKKNCTTRVWVRIAGHANMIKDGTPYHWRCFVNKSGDEIPLYIWSVKGEADKLNFIPGTKAEKDENGLIAWVDVFGDLTIRNHVASIKLQTP